MAKEFRNEEITIEVTALQEGVQEMDEEAAQGSAGDAAKNNMPSQNGGVAPATGSLKKRLRISDSDGENDVKPAGGNDEGDGKELTEADLRRREGEQYS